MLFLTVMPWPYSYYVLLRWVVCGVALYSAWYISLKGTRLLFDELGLLFDWGFWGMLIVAVLFNPIWPVHLVEKELWGFIDLGLALSFLDWISFWRPLGARFRTLRFLWDKRLSGPNSSVTTIFVRPKWETIIEAVSKSASDWKSVLGAQKICREWRYKHFSDLVSGMSFKEAEYIYGPSDIRPSETPDVVDRPDGDIRRFRMSAEGPTGDSVTVLGESMRRFATYGAPHVLQIWCSYSPADQERGGVQVPLGVFLLDDVLKELRQMEEIALGTSLRKPICVKRLRLDEFGLSPGEPGCPLCQYV